MLTFPATKRNNPYDTAKLSRDGLNALGAHPLLRCVSIDRSFYGPLSVADYARYADQVPAHFRFIVKAPASVTDATVRGDKGAPAGDNPAFLDARIGWTSRESSSPVIQSLLRLLGDRSFFAAHREKAPAQR